MTNTELLKVASPDDFIKMGFVREDDRSGSSWGIDYNMRTEKFHLMIDPTYEVKLIRRDVDADAIVLHVTSLSELEEAINFIQ